MNTASAKAHTNIALAKYWGKIDEQFNLPAVPSLSLTLNALWTQTSVQFDDALPCDHFTLNEQPASALQLSRVSALLDRVRTRANITSAARIESFNNFPTASGLASSASGFAALAAAATRAANLDCSLEQLSALARRSSASAARSVFGGFVDLKAGIVGDDTLSAAPLNIEPWDIVMMVVIVDTTQKAVGSTKGMNHCAATSPYYKEWIHKAPQWHEEVRKGVLARDIERVGQAMEASTFAMHACALAADPALLYWKPITLAVLRHIHDLRQQDQLQAWCTMDAGPHVKVLCSTQTALTLAPLLKSIPGVHNVITSEAGPSVQV